MKKLTAIFAIALSLTGVSYARNGLAKKPGHVTNGANGGPQPSPGPVTCPNPASPAPSPKTK